MAKLALVPSKTGYAVSDGNEVVRQQLDGGAGRYRRDIIGATVRVNVQWFLSPESYQYLRTFYNGGAHKGATPFTIDLLLDEPTLTEHTAYLVPDSLRLSGVQGLRHEVTAELEVVPIPRDDAYDEVFIAVFNEYGDDSSQVLNILEVLANVDLPDAAGP